LTPLYKPGDMVRITEWPWNQFAGECVLITKAEVITLDNKEFVAYEWVIPERRGGGAEKFIEEYVSHFDLEALKVGPKT